MKKTKENNLKTKNSHLVWSGFSFIKLKLMELIQTRSNLFILNLFI
jgi:hypothetical protein